MTIVETVRVGKPKALACSKPSNNGNISASITNPTLACLEKTLDTALERSLIIPLIPS